MVVVLDVTPAASTANAYADLTFVTEWLVSWRNNATEWADAANAAFLEPSILWATWLLDSSMDFKGVRRTRTQALRWPRSGVLDWDGEFVDYDTIPLLVKRATAELAYELLVNGDRSQAPGLLGLGLMEAHLGPLKVKTDPGEVKNIIPLGVLSLLEPFGSLNPSAYGSGPNIVRLERN